MTTSSEPVGARLRRLRTERGLSQRDLSAPGVSYAYISRIEAGSRTPSVKALRQLARKLGVSAEYLETGTDLTPAEERELRLREADLQVRTDGEGEKAVPVLRDLEREAEDAGDATLTLRIKVLAALTAEAGGEHAAVIGGLEPLVHGRNPSSVEHWDLYATLGRAYMSSGRADAAVALFRACLDVATREAPHDDVAWVRTATMLSAALTQTGETAEARKITATALDRAGAAGDPHARVQAHRVFARIAAREHRPRAALESLRRATILLEAAEETRELARTHLAWAELLTSEGNADQAENYLELAERLLGPRPGRDDLAALNVGRSRAATAKGDPEAGIEFAGTAVELLAGSDDGTPASAQWALAEAQLAAGRTEEGIRSLHAALDLYEVQRDWYRAAAVSQTLGRVLREAGRNDDALNALERAVQFATLADSGSRQAGAPRP